MSIDEILTLESGPRRTARFAHWLQEIARRCGESVPILVGGSAVELYTGGAYVVLVVRIIAPEDLIVDRLAAAQFWSSEVDFENAVLLLRHVGSDLDRGRLEARVREARVERSHARLLSSEREE